MLNSWRSAAEEAMARAGHPAHRAARVSALRHGAAVTVPKGENLLRLPVAATRTRGWPRYQSPQYFLAQSLWRRHRQRRGSRCSHLHHHR